MPYLDRESFIALLDQLGSENDDEALAAARELDRRVRAAGIGWDELLTPEEDDEDDDEGAEEDFEDEDEDEDADDEAFGEEAGEAEDMDLEDEEARPPRAGAVEGEDDAALIDRMLGEFELSDETRQELLDLKQDIAAGEFTDMDRRYLAALETRLSKKA
jgi:hypothetical protein